jgi:hypothetical protein
MQRVLVFLVVMVACVPDTTSFRTTDRGDDRDPPAAAYRIRTAYVRVWSNGGYVGVGPMTHVGFQIENKGSTVIRFDVDALELALIDNRGRPLPKAAFTAVTPLGPSLVSIWPGSTVTLDSYFRLFVPPQVVAGMRVQWTLVIGQRRYVERTNFVRDDARPVQDYRGGESTVPSS